MSKLKGSAAKKLDKEKKLQQMRRDLLTRELSLDEFTSNKIKQKWFNALLNIRVPEMQANLRHILHYMEKLIETQSFRQLLFEDERQILDEMYDLQAQGQNSAIETLNDIFMKRVEDLNKAYKQQVSDKIKNAEEEFKILESHETFTRENMQTMLFQKEQNRFKKEDQMNYEMFFKIDDERSKNTEKLENLRSTLEGKMEKRWEEIISTLNAYDANTKQRRERYGVLKAKDDSDSKLIYQQMKKTQKLFEMLDTLKNGYENSYAPPETLSLITSLKEERAKFFDSFKYLKKILGEEVRRDKEQLKHLTVITDEVTNELKEIRTKGEKILTLFRICRKFETEEEKVIPVGSALHFLKPTDGMEKRKHLPDERRMSEQRGTIIENLAKDFDVLTKFWKKSSKVRLTMMALNKYMQDLKKENEILKKSLVSYLKEASRPSKKLTYF